jgi:hypothetical protein
MLAWILAPSAIAASGFAVETPVGRFEIARWDAPPAAHLPKADRTCFVGLAWSAASGLTASDHGCPAAVEADALAAVRAWDVRPPVGVARQELGEVWFVYPYEGEGRPIVLVRQSHELRWTLPDGVNVAPFLIRAWSFLRYPAEAHDPSRPDVTCEVEVTADDRGYASNVQVHRCGPPFAEAARGAIADWRFVPPIVDGEPIRTSFSLAATFSAAPYADSSYHPSEESRALWADGQYDRLSHEDRMYFIEAELLGPSERDLGPGHVEISLPPAPDLGGREVPDFFRTADPVVAPIQPIPDHPPRMVVGGSNRPGIEVYELPLPPPESLPDGVDHASCPVIVQVDGSRQVLSWADPTCDDAVRKAVIQTVDQWVLRHDGGPDPSIRARVRAVIDVDRRGSSVTLPVDEIRTPLAELPPGVHSVADARPLERVPPHVPRGAPMPEGTCELVVTVAASGRVERVAVRTCPPGMAEPSVRAVRRWDWVPAERDGTPIASDEPVSIRFQP